MTYHVATLGAETAPNLFFAPNGGGFEGEAHTVTAEHLGNTIRIGRHEPSGRLVPPLMVRDLRPQSVDHAAKKLVFAPSMLSSYDTWGSGLLDGGTLSVLRVVDGRMTEIGTTEILKTTIRTVSTAHPSNRAVAAGQGRLIWSPDSWYRAGATIYMAVAALDETGRRGPWSERVSFVFGARGNPQEQEPNLVNVQQFGEQPTGADLPAPTDLSVTTRNDDRTVELTFTPVPGMRHVVAYSRYEDFVPEETLTLADTSFVQADDLLIARKTFDHTVRPEEAISDRMWGVGTTTSRFGIGSIASFNSFLPAGTRYEYHEEDGEPFIRLFVDAGRTFDINIYTHSGTDQTWYEVLDPTKSYYVRTEMRAQADSQVTIGMLGIGAPNITRPVTTEWTCEDSTFTPKSVLTGSGALPSRISIRGPIALDIRQIYVAASGAEPFAGTPELHETLLTGAPSHVRFHVFCRTNPWSYSMVDFLSVRGSLAIMGNSLPQHLRLLRDLRNSEEGREVAARAGHSILNPWLQVEPFMTNEEWQMLGGYLCTVFDPSAPDSPEQRGAKMRVDQGQIRPWQEEFESIRFEVGNEPWNPLGAFYTIRPVNGLSGGVINGLLLDRAAEELMSATGFDAGKFSFYLGGWQISSSWNADSIAGSKHADFVGYADYNGGWDSGLTEALSAEDPAAVLATLANTNLRSPGRRNRMVYAPELAEICAEASKTRAKPIRGMHYEAGPGYVMNGLNGASVTAAEVEAQERLMKSVAAGTATLDAFLYNSASGIYSTNYFTIAEGNYWKARQKWQFGGAINPAYLWFGFANMHLTGRISLLSSRLSEMLIDGEGGAHGDAVRIYRVERRNGTLAYAFVNVDPANAHEVKLRIPAHDRRWTRHYMTGDLMDHNITLETADTIELLSEDMPEGWGVNTLTVTIPPGKAEAYIQTA